MNRKETTKFLTDLLISTRLSDRKYYAKEVSIDAGSENCKRVDVMEFVPQGVFHVSQIEKGEFVCYEIKSCKNDVFSGNGLNFLGEKNYIVTTMETYKELLPMIAEGELVKFVKEHYPESSTKFGIMVAIPSHIDCRKANDIYEEMQNPTKLDGDLSKWKLHTIYPAHIDCRNRPLVELLFCMLRSKHNSSNQQ